MQLEKIAQFWKSRQPHLQVEKFLERWGAIVVALFAVIYYARYYRSGLNLGGEGGTVAVVAMRLMEGQRPIVDTFLGYNVMWFFPVAWLFELTGPNYIALRLFFFVLCTITGVTAFFIVRRVTGSGWFATLVALGPVLIPGMIFRNYMGFLAVLNMLMLLQAYVFEQRTSRRQWVWIAGAGAALGLTYLVRIDLGAFFTAITLGLIVLQCFGPRREIGARAKRAAGALGVTVVMFGATHAPFYIDAQNRGYGKAFTDQYTGWIGLVRYLAVEQFKKTEPPQAAPPKKDAVAVPAAEPKPAASPAPKTEKDETKDIDKEDYLQKRSFADFLKAKTFYDQAFVLITYLPILVGVIIVLPAGLLFFFALARGDTSLRTDLLAVLITTGSALTLFPQYFFFRPDTPHLSEFMVPFQIAMACTMWIVVRRWWGKGLASAFCILVVTVCVVDLGLYFYHTYPKESAGTIAARWKRKTELVAENGVRVFLKSKEQQELQPLCDLIKKHTKPGDYLVCYPYSPTVNFMTDRPSFEHNIYVDNAFNVSQFHQETLREVAKYNPAAIVIDNRAINGTEESRFYNWAGKTYQWIKENYRYAGTFKRQEVYLRPDLYNP